MSAPSAVHESRVDLLRTLGALARLREERVCFGGRVRPDFVAVDWEDRRLLLADAKATEAATCPATRHRFIRYADEARHFARTGWSVRLAFCHGIGTTGWDDALLVVVRAARLDVVGTGRTVLGADVVTWVDVEAAPLD